MTWNPSLIDGPLQIPLYSEPDAEGVREVTGYVDGYHLNIAPSIYTPDLEPFRVEPSSPDRVFAGAETVFLHFADEAEAIAHLEAYWAP